MFLNTARCRSTATSLTQAHLLLLSLLSPSLLFHFQLLPPSLSLSLSLYLSLSLSLSLCLLVFLCDLLHGAGRQQRNLPVWNDLSSQHYHPNTPPSILCYKGLGKLLFLWDMIKEMLPYVHIFYCPMLEQDTQWFTMLETSLYGGRCVYVCRLPGGWKGEKRTWI